MASEPLSTHPHRFGSRVPDWLSRHELESRVIAWAWKDPGYRRKLLDNPLASIAEETRVAMDASTQVEVLEEWAGRLCLVLPIPPPHASSLSQEELMKWAAGERHNPYLKKGTGPESGRPAGI